MLVQYLMDRLHVAEDSIRIQEEVIMEERKLRKHMSQNFKSVNRELKELVE